MNPAYAASSHTAPDAHTCSDDTSDAVAKGRRAHYLGGLGVVRVSGFGLDGAE
jgi:hypothetical protein